MKEYLRLLVPHFYRQFFSAEQLTGGEEPLAGIAQILGLLATPMMFWSFYLTPKYVDMLARPRLIPYIPGEIRSDEALYLTSSMLVLGILALVNWDSLFPNTTDYSVLMPLPIPMSALFVAKAVALCQMLAAFALAWNGMGILLFPFAVEMPGQSVLATLRFLFAHAAATLLAGAFTFLSIVAVQGLLTNLLPDRALRAVTRMLQFLLLVSLLSALFAVPTTVRREGLAYAAWLPPLWFQGLWQSLAASGDQPLAPFAGRAWLATAAALAATAGTYTLSYFHHVRRTLETLPAPERGPGPVTRMAMSVANFVFVRHPEQRAAFYFTLLGIGRSGRHRVYLSAYAALATAILLRGHLSNASALLIAPTVTFLLLAGLRHLAVIPIDLRANWLFRVSPTASPLELHLGVRKAVFLIAILPVHLACLAVIPLEAVCHSLFLSLCLMETFFFRLKKIPFTCSWLPGRSNMILIFCLFFGGFLVYTTGLAAAQAWAMRLGYRWIMLYFVPALALSQMWRLHLAEPPELEFEDRIDPAVLRLALTP